MAATPTTLPVDSTVALQTQPPVLEITSLQAYISGSLILRGMNLKVNAGEVVALMGRNGVGKTATLRAITGQLPASSGSIDLLGTPLNKLSPDARARAGIGYVPQGRDIFPFLTVEENLRVGLIASGCSGKHAAESTERIYTLFPVLKSMLKRKGGVLSGGQQQQLAIGRALLTQPKLLILDEPTEGIQPSIIDQIGDTLLHLKQETSLTILLVEQYVAFCREVADRFYAMDRGKVTIHGDINELSDEVVRTHLQV